MRLSSPLIGYGIPIISDENFDSVNADSSPILFIQKLDADKLSPNTIQIQSSANNKNTKNIGFLSNRPCSIGSNRTHKNASCNGKQSYIPKPIVHSRRNAKSSLGAYETSIPLENVTNKGITKRINLEKSFISSCERLYSYSNKV